MALEAWKNRVTRLRSRHALFTWHIIALEAGKNRVEQLKVETYALYLAYKDPETPWYARAFAVCVVGYALSPIDLIPDFIPVLGYLDDLIIVPLGITLAVKMVPDPVLNRCRARATAQLNQDKPKNRWGIAIIVAIWLVLFAITAFIVLRIFRSR